MSATKTQAFRNGSVNEIAALLAKYANAKRGIKITPTVMGKRMSRFAVDAGLPGASTLIELLMEEPIVRRTKAQIKKDAQAKVAALTPAERKALGL